MYEQDVAGDGRSPTGGSWSAGDGAGRHGTSPVQAGAHAAGNAVSDVARTAKEQASGVVDEAARQARRVADDAREQLRQRAGGQQSRLADGLRQASGELRQMAGHADSSPIRSIVQDIADRGHRLAAHLDSREPEELIGEVRDFARRRPGAFLGGALVAGFIVGRLGKDLLSGQRSDGTSGDTARRYAGSHPAPMTGPMTGMDAMEPPESVEPAAPDFSDLGTTYVSSGAAGSPRRADGTGGYRGAR